MGRHAGTCVIMSAPTVCGAETVYLEGLCLTGQIICLDTLPGSVNVASGERFGDGGVLRYLRCYPAEYEVRDR